MWDVKCDMAGNQARVRALSASASPALRAFLIVLSLLFVTGQANAQDAAVGTVTSFKLDNGLQVVLIEDHRVPVVTHMVWYEVGAVDDPEGKSGLAHLLEHLMFKSCGLVREERRETFATKISRLGAIDNATTEHDTTNYYQRASKDRLRNLMELEARRMSGLLVADEEVTTERDVVRAERRSNVENDAIKLLAEQMNVALYKNHGYGRPTIGWPNEIVRLTPDDARTAYERFYIPANAIVVVAGDVTPSEVRALAGETYGKINVHRQPPERLIPSAPAPTAELRVDLADARAPQPAVFRAYPVPSYSSAAPGEAEALEVLATILGGGEASRLHLALVTDSKTALAVGGRFMGEGRSSGRIVFFAIAPTQDRIERAEAQLDQVLTDFISNGATDQELARAKASIEARLIIESDNQLTLATRYGQALAVGRSVDDVSAAPGRIQKVTKAAVNAAAQTFLKKTRSVTGILKPAQLAERVQ